MSLTTSIITGFVTPPSNLTLMRGFVTFTISGFDTEGSYSIPAGANRVAVLGPDGSVPAGFQLWRNTEGLRATHYMVKVQWIFRDPIHGDQQMYSDLGVVQVGDNASYDLSELLDAVPIPLPANTYWRSITPYQYDQMLIASSSTAADAEAARQAAEDAVATMAGSVRFDVAQALTAPQKAQALANIEALAYGQPQALTAAQAVRAWRNMGAVGLTGVASAFYFKLPDGTIIQTGTLPAGGEADRRVILPTVFPTFLLTAVVTVVSDDAAAALMAHVSGFANDAFDIRRRAVFDGGGVQPNAGMTVNWIAIGY